MIDRVNQKQFLLWQAEALAASKPEEPQAELPEDAVDLTAEEIAAAKEAVAEAVKTAREEPLTPAPEPPPEEERRGDEALPLEQRSYLPRSVALSLVQSAVDRYLMEHRGDVLLEAPAASTGDAELRDDGSGSDAVADYTLEIDPEDIPPEEEEDDDRRILGAFEITDPGWISSVVAMGWRMMRKSEHFPQQAAEPRELSRDARVVVVGDWASGTSRAQRVAAEMRVAIDEAKEAGRECHVVHLGDTYYAGWAFEYEQRFLPHWPVTGAEKDEIGSWSLPGNHDMYTGGHGYYSTLLVDERFKPWQQGSSRFSLQNEHWQLLGLDTSWTDHKLKGDQAEWVAKKLPEKNEGPRTMLLSHHQPRSAWNTGGRELRQALAKPLDEGRIDAWLWGHEHRCAVYDPPAGTDYKLPFGSCIGHGGVPVYAPAARPPGVRWQLDRSFRVGLEAWAYLGFAVLDFDGPEISIAYINEFGETDHEEQIQ